MSEIKIKKVITTEEANSLYSCKYIAAIYERKGILYKRYYREIEFGYIDTEIFDAIIESLENSGAIINHVWPREFSKFCPMKRRDGWERFDYEIVVGLFSNKENECE